MTTNYNDPELRREINQLLDDLESRGEHLQPQWVAEQICLAHRAGLKDDESRLDVAFWIFTGYLSTRKVSTECINQRHPAHRSGRQRLLPYDGFQRAHLQDYYVVLNEDGVEVGIPTRDCTDAQLAEKADFHRGLARIALAHAFEIDRYIEWRRTQAPAPTRYEQQSPI